MIGFGSEGGKGGVGWCGHARVGGCLCRSIDGVG